MHYAAQTAEYLQRRALQYRSMDKPIDAKSEGEFLVCNS